MKRRLTGTSASAESEILPEEGKSGREPILPDGEDEWWSSDEDEGFIVDRDDQDAAAADATMYGSDLDDEDERWVDDRRKGRDSDAILSCPLCFETLCLTCEACKGGLYFAKSVEGGVVRVGVETPTPQSIPRVISNLGVTVLHQIHCDQCSAEVRSPLGHRPTLAEPSKFEFVQVGFEVLSQDEILSYYFHGVIPSEA